MKSKSFNEWQTLVLFAAGIVLMIAGLTAIVNISQKESRASNLEQTGKSIEFALDDLNGNAIRSNDYRGRNVIVNFWATWCIPCRTEMPDLVAFYRAHQAQDVAMLAINVQDDAAKARDFVREQGIFFPVPYDTAGSTMKTFGVLALPSTFLIDRTGVVRFAWEGPMTPTLLDQKIAPLLYK